jgi:hypothetical protein
MGGECSTNGEEEELQGAARSLPFSYGNCHMKKVASLPHPVV